MSAQIVCLTCGTTEGPFERNHLGSRALWPDIWFWFCVPCHQTFTAWQMDLGIVRAGPKGSLSTLPRGEAGRTWALIEGAIIALMIAIQGCPVCEEGSLPLFISMGQATGVVAELLAAARAEPPIRTDPVGADDRSIPNPGNGLHERGLVQMLAVVGVALDPDLAPLCARMQQAADLDLVIEGADGWMSEFGLEFEALLEALFSADTLRNVWDELSSSRGLTARMQARIESALPSAR